MTRVRLEDLFGELQDRHFANRAELEDAVLEVFNRHVAELPIGYSYQDAIDGARAKGWLITNGAGHGVRVDLSGAEHTVAAGSPH
jgi:hypothetical protein